jgi:hypothetical protein
MNAKQQAIRTRQIKEGDAMSAATNDIINLMHDAPMPDFAQVATFKLEMNNWLWERKDVLDYYKMVDAINDSIAQASDKAARMNEWREWRDEVIKALRYLDGVVEVGHNSIGVNAMELMWNIQYFNKNILGAWADFDALRSGLKVEPQLAEKDESGQRFDDPNYLPF